MREVVLPEVGSVAAWRKEARALASQGIRAEDVVWRRTKLGLRMDEGEIAALDQWMTDRRHGTEAAAE